MSTRITRALVCDGCSAEFDTPDGDGEEMAIARAEAGWRQFTMQLRRPYGTVRKPTIHVCPACSPRAIADRVRAEDAARQDEIAAERQAKRETAEAEQRTAARAAGSTLAAVRWQAERDTLTPAERQAAETKWKSEYDDIVSGDAS